MEELTESVKKQFVVLRHKMAVIVDECEDMLRGPSDNYSDFLEMISDVTRIQDKHSDLTGKLVDSLPFDKVDGECKKLTNENQILRALLRKLRRKMPPAPQAGTSSTSAASSHNAGKVKMPTLELPKFDGKIIEFLPFWDQFRCAVHEVTNLSAVQKFIYLKSSLRGGALECITGYDVTESNYPLAVESLKARFGKKRVVIGALVKSLLALEQRGNSTKHLREFTDTLQSRIRTLEGQGLDVNNQSVQLLLIPWFEQKLKADLLKEWELEVGTLDDALITLTRFFSFIDRQVTAREASDRSKLNSSASQDHSVEEDNNYDFSMEEPASTSAGLVSKNSNAYNMPQAPAKPQSTPRGPAASTYLGPRPPYRTPARAQNFIGYRFAAPPQVSSPNACGYCENSSHQISDCRQFSGLSIENRWRWAQSNRKCYSCLETISPGHISALCSSTPCSISGCVYKHHPLLHPPNPTMNNLGNVDQRSTTLNGNTILQSGRACLQSGNKSIEICVLFDTGSQRSYIRQNIVDSLQLDGPLEKLSVSTLGGDVSTKTMKNLSLSLYPRNGNKQPIILKALSIDKICDALPPLNFDPTEFDHLKNLEFADVYPRGRETVDLLVGLDYYFDIVHGGKCRRGGHGAPLAIDSKLGWILCGYSANHDPTITSLNAPIINTESCNDENLNDQLEKFWSLDTVGVVDSRATLVNEEDDYAMKYFEETLSFNGSRYVVKIPWKPNAISPPDNYALAEKSLYNLERRLLKDPVRAREYCDAINQYESHNVSEEVIAPPSSSTFINYFTHHAVYRDDKNTTKTRVVMNGSLRGSFGVSLNDCMFAGPALQPDQFAIFLRWRTHKVALVSDIKKMFLQIELNEDDRDSHRYLWRNLDMSAPPRVFRFNRVTFGVAASPFLAIATVQHHAHIQSGIFPVAAREILNNMYVDDCLSGSFDTASALQLKADLSSLMKSGGFELTKWASNCKSVMNRIPESDRNPVLISDEPACMKVLGVCWEPDTDTISIDVKPILDSVDTGTKRSTVSLVAKFYDPFGLVSPFTLKAKLLLKELWLHGKCWDDVLDPCCVQKWRDWKSQLDLLKSLKVSRYFSTPHDSDSYVELHCFTDASEEAYGSVVYCRIIRDNGVETNLVMSKCRIAPSKRVTVPRLELLGTLVGAKLVSYVAEVLNLPIKNIVCWSDSLVALCWIRKSPRTLHTFVANRVEQIQDILSPDHFRYCPGSQNPADLLTRGSDVGKLIKNELWWKGPDFLLQKEEFWPVPPSVTELTKTVAEKEEKSTSSTCTYTTVQSGEFSDVSAGIMNAANFSSWSKLRRVTAYVFLAVDKFRKRGPKSSVLSVEYLQKAERFWLGKCQSAIYQCEMDNLRKGENLNLTSKILKLDPYLDEDELLRVGGRLEHANIATDAKHQIILPHHNWITKLVAEHHHQRASHVGVDNSHAIIRQKYWIVHGKRELKRILHRCLKCSRQTTKPYSQKMANLPNDRLSVEPSFSVVGIDFAGPLYIRPDCDDDEQLRKVYICLFTCATSRMVHLELVKDLSTRTFLMAWRRMTNRRGLCHTVWSDNARTFKSADQCLKLLFSPNNITSLDLREIMDTLSVDGIQWKFITERAPWQGGFWERLVQSVKVPLRKILGRAVLSYDELFTILTDVEAAINSRPLTPISADPNDNEALTPAHLSIGRPLLLVPDSPLSTDSVRISDRYLYLQRTLNALWRRWLREYMPLLSPRQKWLTESPPCKIGDLVLISEDKVKRGQWPLARVVQVFEGRDGLIRSVMVRTRKGLLRRPVQKLHLLESTFTDT